MKTYEGIVNRQTEEMSDSNATGSFLVFRDGDPLPFAPSLKLRRHSPDGPAWGYTGSGPSQLALALLLDALDDEERALNLYQDFKFRVVAAWPQDEGWTITQDEIKSICRVMEDERNT